MEYLELQGVIRDGAVITEVKEEKNRIYFKIDGHQFATFGFYVHHEKHYAYNHPFSDMLAKKYNTAEGIAEEEKQIAEIQDESELYHKHKKTLYKLIFLKALEIYAKAGDEQAMADYIDHHFDIMPNGDNCQELIKRLEEPE